MLLQMREILHDVGATAEVLSRFVEEKVAYTNSAMMHCHNVRVILPENASLPSIDSQYAAASLALSFCFEL